MESLIAIEPELSPSFPSATRQIHIYRASLIPPKPFVSRLRELLTRDERARADRLIDPADGARFTAGRAALRLVLARYIDPAPGDIRFDYGERGKPALAQANPGPAFNVSHSGDQILIAVSNCATVGVDIEYERESVDILKLARRYFCPEEIEALESVNKQDQRNAFFDCWTRKESYMKAVGDGFRIPLKSFCVSLRPADDPALQYVDGQPAEAARWTIRAVHAGENYRASVVAPSPIDRIENRRAIWQTGSANPDIS